MTKKYVRHRFFIVKFIVNPCRLPPPCNMRVGSHDELRMRLCNRSTPAKPCIYMLSSSRTVMSFLSNGLSERMASLKGT